MNRITKNMDTTEQYLDALIFAKNYEASWGVVVFRNGVMLKIRKFFDYFKEMWNEYKLVESTGTDEEYEMFMKDATNGGIVSNNEMDVYLPDVSAMISEYRFAVRGTPLSLDDFPELMKES